MNMAEIKKKAKKLNINPGKMKKNELIRAIQEAEGNPSCFGKSMGNCSNTNCCFIDDCLKIKE